MKRYLIIGSGLLIGVNQFCWLLYIHWQVGNNSWLIFDSLLTTIIVLGGIINNRSLYAFVIGVCSFLLVIESIRIYMHYPGEPSLWYFKLWWFVRPACLLIAIYTMIKTRMELKNIHRNHKLGQPAFN